MVLLCYLTAILARDARRLESRSLLQSLPNSKYSRPIFMCTILLKNAFSHSLNILSNDAIVVHLTFARMPPPIRQIRYSFTHVFFALYMIRGTSITILVLLWKHGCALPSVSNKTSSETLFWSSKCVVTLMEKTWLSIVSSNETQFGSQTTCDLDFSIRIFTGLRTCWTSSVGKRHCSVHCMILSLVSDLEGSPKMIRVFQIHTGLSIPWPNDAGCC